MRGCGVCVFAVTLCGCGGGTFSASDDGGGPDSSAYITSQESGSPPTDAGATEGTPSHWCTGRHGVFCADFDEVTGINELLSAWSSYGVSGGAFSLSMGTDVPSPPNALMVTADSNANVILVQTFPGAMQPSHARLEFDLRIDQVGPVGLLSAASFAAIAAGTTENDGVVALAIGSGPTLTAAWVAPQDAGASDAGTFSTANSTQPFPTLGQWAGRYAIDVTYSTSTTGRSACAQVYAGPTPLLSQCLALPSSLASPKLLSIALGALSGGLKNTGHVQIRFDNVTFAFQ
jgi:hypothetical protein